ncbi:MAG TPA: TlpA disulfide reductase family protein [Cytophagales bacterium]|nr:TlpA disulfide reductase family protein [Cytophagales bacterium]
MFKKILYILVCTTAYVYAKPITVSGKATNFETGKIYLYVYDGIELDLVDSTKVKGGTFSIKKDLPRGLYKIGVSSAESADIILGKENIQVEFDKKDLLNTFKVRNSLENDAYGRFNKANASFSQNLQGIEAKAQSLYQIKLNDPGKFDVEIRKLQSSVDSLSNILYAEYDNIGKNTSLFAAKYASALKLRDSTKKQNVFKSKELQDPELCRSNLFAIKTQMYFQRYTKPEVSEYQNAADELIRNLATRSKGKEQVYKTMLSIFANANLDYYSTVLSQFKKEYGDDRGVQDYIKKLPKRDISVGDEVPNIVLKDTLNRDLSLTSLRGKVVLIDFWASWCGPCRAENPNVVRVYNKYKDKGFTVFGVSLDQNREKWLGAIKSDGLAWSHVSDLKGWASEGAKLYGVKSIPQTFLIDKEGKVIAKNLRGEMLEQKLKEIFNE